MADWSQRQNDANVSKKEKLNSIIIYLKYLPVSGLFKYPG